MASGAKVDDEVKEIFKEMKIPQSGAERIRVVVLHIVNDIKVEHIYRQKDVGDQSAHKFLKGIMKEDCCRYYLYDCHYEIEENLKREELVFILWAPNAAKCKSKMKYASSKYAVDKVVDGVKHNKQMNDIADMDKDSFASMLTSGRIHKLEGEIV